MPNAPLFAAARELAARGPPHQTGAAARRVEAIEAAATLPFDGGLPPRARALPRVRRSGEQAKALIHVFFAERAAAKIPGRHRRTAAHFRSRASRSSAPAPWAAASRWPARTPASTVAARPTRRRRRSTRAWPRFGATTTSSVKRGPPHRARRRRSGSRASRRSVGYAAARRRRSRDRGRVREHGAEAADFASSTRSPSPAACWRPTRRRSTSTRSRRRRRGPTPSSACTSSARRNVMRLVEIVRGAADRRRRCSPPRSRSPSGSARSASSSATARVRRQPDDVSRTCTRAQFLVEEGATPGAGRSRR